MESTVNFEFHMLFKIYLDIYIYMQINRGLPTSAYIGNIKMYSHRQNIHRRTLMLLLHIIIDEPTKMRDNTNENT